MPFATRREPVRTRIRVVNRTSTSTGGSQIDVLIVGAKVIDGTGNPWQYADLALSGQRVAAVVSPGQIDRSRATTVVDAEGLIVCPGFIDIQSHSIVPFLTDRRALSKVTQGVTTEIMGESWTPAPFGGRITTPFGPGMEERLGDVFEEWDARARQWSRFGDWLDDLEHRGVSVNFGSFIGGGTVREYGKGFATGDASPDELNAMRSILDEAMRDGAFGIATALIYPPGAYAGTDELVALCEVVAAHRGVHITHVRSEDAGLLEAMDEAIEIAQRTGVATEIYHLKAAGTTNWDKMPAAIEKITDARAAGIDLTADMYPYIAAGTGLATCLPLWAEEDDRLFENLADPAIRARMRREMLEPSDDWENMGLNAGPENIVLAGLLRPEHLQYRGKSLAAAAAARGQVWADTAMDLIAAEGNNFFAFYFDMSGDNLRLQMRQPWIAFATDAGGVDPATLDKIGLLHPRAFGTYPRVLGHFVRDEGVLTLEDAVRKMSGAVAARLGLRERGLLRAGMYADVVAFDPTTIADRATFENPHQLSVGIQYLWVNGQPVLADGVHTNAHPGHRLHGPGYQA